MSFPIEQIDTRTVDESKLKALHQLYLEWDAEWTPDDPVMPFPKRLAEWRNVRELEDVRRWVAWDGDRAVGTTGVYLHRTQDLDNAWGWLFVSRDGRQNGLGRALARFPVDYARENNRKRIAVGVLKDSGYGVIPERAGMKAVYNERVSQLRVSDLDLAMLEGWVERAAERAKDYELLFLPMPIPEEYRARMIKVMHVMSTAPLEEFEEDPTEWDDEMLQDVEAVEMRKQNDIYTYVACHKPTGDFVGYTSLVFQSLHPEKANQWDTGVDPEHRNLGLGRWLKAAMMLKFLDEHPDVKVVETHNADSNDPMLNINVAMGFKPTKHEVVYQGELGPVIDYLNL
jgi:GNAT superfamily N-acetyltransferase